MVTATAREETTSYAYPVTRTVGMLTWMVKDLAVLTKPALIGFKLSPALKIAKGMTSASHASYMFSSIREKVTSYTESESR